MLGEHLNGLMNLSGFATVLSLTYVGLDRFDPTASKFQLARSRAVGVISTVFEPALLKRRLSEVYSVGISETLDFEWEILGLLVGERDRIQYRSLRHFAYVQTHAPLLRHFQRRRDVVFVLSMALPTLLSFLATTAATVWNIPWINNPTASQVLYWFYALVVAVVFVHLFLLYRYAAVEDRVYALASAIARRMNSSIQCLPVPKPKEPPLPSSEQPATQG